MVAASQIAIRPSQRPTRAAPSPPLRPSVRWAVSRPRRARAIAKSPSAAASAADAHARTSVSSSKKREAAMASGHDGDRDEADDERCGGARISRARQLHRGHCLTYGRPTAAGGIERPTTPATTTSVTTYGSAAEERRPGRIRAVRSGQPQREGLGEAEEQARGERPERPPAAEDDRRERDEASPGGHVLRERVRDAVREVHPAHARRARPTARPRRSGSP